jgi:NADPH2:quinone reductase
VQAIAILEFGGPELLALREMPDPEPGPDEVRIRVATAGVNPSDWKIRQGLVHREGVGLPFVPGVEVAGVIDAVGHGVTDLAVGDDVMAIVWGGYAELAVAQRVRVARRPEELDVLRAGALPVVALTAVKAVIDVDVQPGETVLVHAAAGGVGGVVVVLAARRGARVIGTASTQNHDYVRGLGAHDVIDYRAGDVNEATRRLVPNGVDVVIDCLGGHALSTSAGAMRDGGRFISVVDEPDPGPFAARGQTATLLGSVRADGAARLDELAPLVVTGELPLHIEATYPLAEARAAQERSQTGHVRGKLVLDLR